METSQLTHHSRAGKSPTRLAEIATAAIILLAVWSAFVPDVCAQPREIDARQPARVEAGMEWRSLYPSLPTGEAPRFVVRDKTNGMTAFSDESGVSVAWGERRDRAVLPAVQDLAIGPEGSLWIATRLGLFRWEEGGRPRRRDLRGGEKGNDIRAIAASSHGILIATGAGASWSTKGRMFQRLDAASPTLAVTDVAMTWVRATEEGPLQHPGQIVAWLVQEGRLLEVRGIVTEAGLRVSGRRSFSLPRPAGERAPVDLWISDAPSRIVMLFEDVLASRELKADASIEGRSPWIAVRPTLPPGARMRRWIESESEIWIATDRGILTARTSNGPFRRAAAPVGTTACADVHASVSRAADRVTSVIALCARGLYLGESRSRNAPPVPVPVPVHAQSAQRSVAATTAAGLSLRPDPPLSEIRKRALRRAGLTAERSSRLRKGLARRAYWPEVGIRLGIDIDRDEDWDSDQAYVSSGTRHTVDRTRGRRDGFSAGLELDWDLGGLVYPEDSVDLSRELRQVLSLRDDVSDEINQLYVERQGIRARLASMDPIDPVERQRLNLRAVEVREGLDAWTGGWLTEWSRTHPSSERASD